jgi:hypothetical protein
MNLNDIFSASPAGGADTTESVFVKYDYKSQFIRFRFLEEFDDLKANAQVSHWVKGVGLVACNLKPLYDKNKGTIFLWDGWGKDKNTGVRINKSPEFNCVFCAETRRAKDEAGNDLQAQINAGNLHRRSQSFIANVVYEVLERKAGQKKPEVVKAASQGLLRIRINDLFSDKGKGEYKTLNNFNDIKGTLAEHWFVMNGEGRITPDDFLGTAEREETFDLLERKPPMEYLDGKSRYLKKQEASSQAEPFHEDDIAF